MEGVVIGGWEFVWAAYAITFGGLLGYGVWLVKRYRSSQ
jgi:hypothetical protein